MRSSLYYGKVCFARSILSVKVHVTVFTIVDGKHDKEWSKNIRTKQAVACKFMSYGKYRNLYRISREMKQRGKLLVGAIIHSVRSDYFRGEECLLKYIYGRFFLDFTFFLQSRW
jgi:hypothetical protein